MEVMNKLKRSKFQRFSDALKKMNIPSATRTRYSNDKLPSQIRLLVEHPELFHMLTQDIEDYNNNRTLEQDNAAD